MRSVQYLGEYLFLYLDAWKDLPKMIVARANASCFQYGDRIYVFGGRSTKNKLSKKIEVFLVDSNKWELLNVFLAIFSSNYTEE